MSIFVSVSYRFDGHIDIIEAVAVCISSPKENALSRFSSRENHAYTHFELTSQRQCTDLDPITV